MVQQQLQIQKQIKKWNKDGLYECTYETDFEEDKFGLGLDVYNVHMTDFCWDDYTDFYKMYSLNNNLPKVYDELRNIFGADSSVVIIIRYYDGDGNLLYTTIDGEDFVD